MKHAFVGLWCGSFGIAFFYGTTGNSDTAVVLGGCGMVFCAYQLLLLALGKWDEP